MHHFPPEPQILKHLAVGGNWQMLATAIFGLGSFIRKHFARIVAILFVSSVFVMFFGSTWNYGYNCTRCGYYEQRLKRRLCGVTLWESTRVRRNAYEQSYLELFKQPCSHSMKSGGFGHNPGCGMTAQGSVFSGRNKAVKALFEAFQRYPDAALARESFALVEQLFPAETTVQDYHRWRAEGTNMVYSHDMETYAEWIDLMETSDEWKQVNEAARRRDFFTSPVFLDEKLLRAKLNSSSRVVQAGAKRQLYSKGVISSPF